jgi:large subunit ribosomal protein L20
MRLATVHRRQKKREYRGLWIIRIGAACRQQGLPYGRLMEGLTKSGVRLNRKMLSEIAIHDPQGFAGIVGLAKTALA